MIRIARAKRPYDEQGMAAEDDTKGLGGRTRDVDDDLDGAGRLEDVNGRPAIGGGSGGAWHFLVQFQEEGSGVFGQIRRARLKEILHNAIIQGRLPPRGLLVMV